MAVAAHTSETLDHLFRSLSAKHRSAARRYFKQGAVSEVTYGNDEIKGTVTGDSTFYPSLGKKGADWNWKCTCKSLVICSHVGALLLSLIKLPTPQSTPSHNGDLLKAYLIKFGPPSQEHKALIEHLKKLFKTLTSQGFLIEGALSEFVPRLPTPAGWQRLRLFSVEPRDELEFTALICVKLESWNCDLPQEFVDLVPVGWAVSARDKFLRDEKIAEWTRTFETAEPVSTKAVSVYEFRLQILPDRAVMWARKEGKKSFEPLTERKMAAVQKQYLEGTLKVTTESLGIWSLYSSMNPVRHYFHFNSKAHADPLLHRALQLFPDQIWNVHEVPYTRSTQPLIWKRVDHPSGASFSIKLAYPDGRLFIGLIRSISGNPTFYLSETEVAEGPAVLSSRFEEIPVEAVATSAALRFFQRHNLELPSEVARSIESVKLQLRVICLVDKSQHGFVSDYLSLQIQGVNEQGRAVKLLHPSLGWIDKPDEAGTKDLVLVQFPNQSLFPDLLTSLGALPDSVEARWRLRLTKTAPAHFVEWVEALPKAVQVTLDDELKTLFESPVEVGIELECTEAQLDWFDMQVNLTSKDYTLTKEELSVLLAAKGGYVRVGNKGWRRAQYRLTPEEDQALARMGLSPNGFSEEPQRMHALQLSDPAAKKFLPEGQAAQIQKTASQIQMRITPEVPTGIAATLRPYQVEGFHFLAYLSTNSFGGILADDMGLGKTLQTLTWLAWLKSDSKDRHQCSLIVCPKSVTDGWLAECLKFWPEGRAVIWKGGTLLATAVSRSDLVITNYSQLRISGDDLAKIEWRAVVLDEGQYIKNPSSQVANAARALRASHRLILSGTPVENRLMDLWSLMSFSMPGVLGNRAGFGRIYDSKKDPLATSRLSARLRPFLLRRTKSAVAQDLPDKIEEDVYMELEGEQKLLYQAELKLARQTILGVESTKDLSEKRFNILTSILRLRQICCHPRLINDQSQAPSAKIEALMDLVEPLIEEGHKVLIFSQFIGVLEILKAEFAQRNCPHFYLAGDTEDRGSLVKAFQEHKGAATFLISLKAGGFGLNLTAASYVILFDPWWNPAVENQAIDRTHRIGQVNKVIAYRLLVRNTIEEKIRVLQKKKQELAEGVLGETGGSLTLQDLQFLFSE